MTAQTDFILYSTPSGDVRLQVMLLEESAAYSKNDSKIVEYYKTNHKLPPQ